MFEFEFLTKGDWIMVVALTFIGLAMLGGWFYWLAG
jgi:hypothetical protein